MKKKKLSLFVWSRSNALIRSTFSNDDRRGGGGGYVVRMVVTMIRVKREERIYRKNDEMAGGDDGKGQQSSITGWELLVSEWVGGLLS